MLETPISAAGEAVSSEPVCQNISRRHLLRSGAAGLAATTLATTALAESEASTPDERIEAAMTEIEAAMTEKYPGWRFQRKNEPVHSYTYVHGGPDRMNPDPFRHVLLIYGYEGRYGTEDARWYVDYPQDQDRRQS